MREIKFRGYDGADWIYGISVNHELGNGCDNWRMIHSDGELDEWINVLNVGQYTGVKDATESDIYVGDVVDVYYRFKDFNESKICVVEIDPINPSMFLRNVNNPNDVEYDFIKCGLLSLMIKGNIYENPELLAGDSK